jgi:hypothetical protein
MNTKHRILQILAIAGLASGCLLGLLVLRRLFLGHLGNVWAVMDLLFVCGLIAYLISASIRGIRWAKGQGTVGNGQIKWGRVYLGALLIFVEIKNHWHPAPNLLKPSNEAQAAGMTTAAIALVFLGTWLVISGITSRFKGRIRGGESSKVVP